MESPPYTAHENSAALLQRGITSHRAGDLPSARRLYQEILRREPDQPDALNLLGVLAEQTGDVHAAVALGRRACSLDASNASYHLNLGNALRSSGQIPEAVAEFRHAIRCRPDYAEAYNNLGLALADQQEHESAIAALERAIALAPTAAKAFNNLGVCLRQIDRLTESLAACAQAVALDPAFAAGFDNLGLALADIGRFDEAITAHRRATELEPGSAVARNHLGAALRRFGQPREAVDACRAAIALAPGLAAAHNNLGNALLDCDQTKAAVAALREAIRLDPTLADAKANLCLAEYRSGRFDSAVAAGEAAIEADPAAAAAHWNLSHALLIRGDLRRGFAEYEWRTRCRPPLTPAAPPIARWTGQPLAGKTILLQAEQGFGDTIQFVRYAKSLADSGAIVLLQCPSELVSLLRMTPGIVQILSSTEAASGAEYFSPLMSLPFRLSTMLETIPATAPYVQADPHRAGIWRSRVSAEPRGMHVGLVWAGRPKHGTDRRRSLPLSAFAPLGGIPGIRFHSLQKGPAAEQARSGSPLRIADYGDALMDFADTAALIANLDLVIAVDTAVAHLAGAMGKPVWVLLPVIPDWRWMLDRDDSPWYPRMRLFRQTCEGEWNSVVSRIAALLSSGALPGPGSDQS